MKYTYKTDIILHLFKRRSKNGFHNNVLKWEKYADRI
jgi:hypothetical protein